jgi:hypothetical protein
LTASLIAQGNQAGPQPGADRGLGDRDREDIAAAARGGFDVGDLGRSRRVIGADELLGAVDRPAVGAPGRETGAAAFGFVDDAGGNAFVAASVSNAGIQTFRLAFFCSEEPSPVMSAPVHSTEGPGGRHVSRTSPISFS